MKSNALLLLFPIFVVSLAGCMHMDAVPYAITEPECKIGKVENAHDFVGIHFTFFNNTEKKVNNFKFSFIVFDSSGEYSPLPGNNVISARYMQVIDSNAANDIIFSLDSYVHQIPTEPFIVDFFYISKIEYDDGSVWTDPYGAWMPGGL